MIGLDRSPLSDDDDPDSPDDVVLKEAEDLAQLAADPVARDRGTHPARRDEADARGRIVARKAKDRYPEVTALSRLAALAHGGKFVASI